MGKLERMYFHMLWPDELQITEAEDKYLKALKIVFSICSYEMSYPRQRRMIERAIVDAGSKWRITGMINDAVQLFGDMIKINKQFSRSVMREKFLQIARKAEEDGELETARLCYVNIMRLDGLDIHDAQKIDLSQLELPEVIITSDPNVLEIEGEYEEVDE